VDAGGEAARIHPNLPRLIEKLPPSLNNRGLRVHPGFSIAHRRRSDRIKVPGGMDVPGTLNLTLTVSFQ